MKTLEEFVAFAAYVRDRVNPMLFAYAFCTSMLHREDTKNVRVPTIAEMFPQKFVNCAAIEKARERANIFQRPSDRVSIFEKSMTNCFIHNWEKLILLIFIIIYLFIQIATCRDNSRSHWK